AFRLRVSHRIQRFTSNLSPLNGGYDTAPHGAAGLSSDLRRDGARRGRTDDVVAGAADHDGLSAPLGHEPGPFGLWCGSCEVGQPSDVVHVDVVGAGA